MEIVHRNDETDSVVLEHSETQVDSASIEQHPVKKVKPDEEYCMNHKKRGIAIVINHENFDPRLKNERDGTNLPKREGTNKDKNDVRAVLENLQFDVRIWNDHTKTQLFEELKKVAQEDHRNHDCLVVVVMTHGGRRELYAKDRTYKVDELWNTFTGNSCTALHGKPKLFFIHASFYENAYAIRHGDTVDAQGTSGANRTKFTIPTMANLLVMYSIYDGDKQRRDASNGSWFIQSLCAVLNSYGHSIELLRMLTMVSRMVEKNYRQFVPDNEKSNALKKMPCVVSMLTKALYFRRKPDDHISSQDANDLNNSQELHNINPPPRSRSRKGPPPEYSMQNMQRKAYIFHNQTFGECLNGKILKSGIKDAEELKSALEYLGFSVDDSSKDLTKCELKEKMTSVASENHEDTGCVLFAIMTYGENNSLYAKDDTYTVTELWDQLSNTNCPTLSGKPKVFLIQTCTDDVTNCNSIPPQDVLVMHSPYNEIANSNEQAELTPTIFIQTLCDEFYDNGKNRDLFNMLESVRIDIANNINHHNEQEPADGENQTANYPMPILQSGLIKKLYFR